MPEKEDPFVMMKKQDDGTVTYEGYCIDLLNELAKKLHLTYDIYPSPDPSGTWNGMIAELINKVCELLLKHEEECFIRFPNTVKCVFLNHLRDV